MAHGVVRTDNMSGTDVRADLVSFKFYAGSSDSVETAIDNGNVVKIGALLTGEREVYKATKFKKGTPLSELALVASPEVMYDEHKHNLSDFENEAGAEVRGYVLRSGNVFSVTADALIAASTIAVGNVVELADDETKLTVVSTATASATTVGTVIAIEKTSRYTYYVIKIK